jgi:dynein heavy chain
MVLIRAMRDSNIPKFLKDDVPLFNAIIQDLFPGVEMEKNSHPELEGAIEECFKQSGLINDPVLREKIIQFNETMNVRFGLMIIGPALTGKTTCVKALKDGMNFLAEKFPNDSNYLRVQMETLNPKSISMAELYGQFS